MEECETESGKQILLSQAHVLSSSCLAGSARIAEFTRRWLELSWGRSTDNGRGHCEPRPFHPQTLSLSLIQQPNAAKAGEARNEQGACDSIPPNRSASPSPPYTSPTPTPTVTVSSIGTSVPSSDIILPTLPDGIAPSPQPRSTWAWSSRASTRLVGLPLLILTSIRARCICIIQAYNHNCTLLHARATVDSAPSSPCRNLALRSALLGHSHPR